MSFDETEKLLAKPETQLVLGFGTLLVNFLCAKVTEAFPQIGMKPMSQEDARATLAEIHGEFDVEAATAEFDAFLDGQPWHSIDEHQAGRSEVVDDIRHPKKN
jgi:hypothetical protein